MNPLEGSATDPDPIEAVTARGWRVVWVSDLEGELLILEHERLILVDADMPRRTAADAILADLNAHP